MRAVQVNTVPRLELTAYESKACAANQFKGSPDAVNQLRFGLFGEIGGLLAAVKKERRDLAPAEHNGVTEELGDALWYATTVAVEYGASLQEIGVATMLELQTRFHVQKDAPGDHLSFEEIDGLLSYCHAQIEALDLGKELRQLGAHTGQLLHLEATRDLADKHPRDLLAAIFADMAVTAFLFKQKLAEIARTNLHKIESRWPPKGTLHIPLFDEKMGPLEQLPRLIEMHFIERSTPTGKPYVVQQWNGVNIGDRLTDNRLQSDGYRFHDVFHLAYVVHLGWSPVVRALLKLKRKSDPALDENEDGARATIIEEGIATWIFNQASGHNFFKDVAVGRLDYGMLKQVQEMVDGYEVAACPVWQWERAILEGFEIFRQLHDSGGGIVIADLQARTLSYRELVVEPATFQPPSTDRPKLIGTALPPQEFLQ